MVERYSDQFYMQQALNESRAAAAENEVPVGAVLVCDGEILSRAHNQVMAKNDPSAHAEILALKQACKIKKNYRLPGSVLYVTLEPCAMCLGAMVQARISRLVFGAQDLKAGAVESIMKFPFEKTNHRIRIQGGLLSEECGQILKDFFKARR